MGKIPTNVNASIKGNVPTNNATMQVRSIINMLKGTNIDAMTQHKLANSVKALAKGQTKTAVAAINAAKDAGISIGTQYFTNKALETKYNAETAKSVGSQAYAEALAKWNAVISQNPSNQSAEGDSGSNSGSNTTGTAAGSALGG